MGRKKILPVILGIIFALLLVGCGGETAEKPAETRSVKLILDYEKTLFSTATSMNVYVDDIYLGKQEEGKKVEYTFSLEDGTHEFYLKNDGVYSTKKLEFEVSEDDTEFNFGAKINLTFGVKVWVA